MKRESQQALQQAMTALNGRDFPTADSLCREVLVSDPQCVDALNLLSLARKGLGDTAAAETLMKQALALDPRRADIRANLANLYAPLGRNDEAQAEYRRALEIAPRFRPARLGLARVMLRLGRMDEALTEAATLTKANAADAEAWNVAGSAYRQRGSLDDAEQAFRRALSAAPAYAAARHNLGALLASLGRSEEALAELDRAASAGMDGAEIRHNRAAALMSLGRLDEAEALLHDALVTMPEAVSLQMLLSRIRYMRGDEGFADVLQNAVDSHPDNTALRVACSRVLRGAERFDAAVEAARGGLERNPGEPQLLAEMSTALHNHGAYDEALDFARRAVAAAPHDPALNDLVIQALLSLGAGAEAMPLIEAARRRSPLNQFYVALEATAARLIGDARYERLYDYGRLVQRFELPVPSGWPSIEAFHADLIPVLNERHKFVAPPLDQSLRGGTQTPRSLLNDPDPAVQAFLEAVRAPLAAYRDSIGQQEDHPLTSRNHGATRLAGCWSVRLQRSGFHVNHVHSEGWISSAYYVDLPDEIRDANLKSGWIKFGEPGFFVPGAHAESVLQPAAGVLLLFPSYMWHGTTAIRGDAPRMTIAFDAVPTPQ